MSQNICEVVRTLNLYKTSFPKNMHCKMLLLLVQVAVLVYLKYQITVEILVSTHFEKISGIGHMI